MTLVVGDKAPDFTLHSADAERVTLSEITAHRRRTVVLFFYPKDDTPGCTAEACGFRDLYEEFARAGAEIIGISSDSTESHLRFVGKHKLPMKLLSDREGRVRRLYDVRATLGILPGRVTFVIDPEGVIRHVFSSQFRIVSHVERALAVVRQIEREAKTNQDARAQAKPA